MTDPTTNVVHMETAARLIREAQEAREKRKAERQSGPHTKRLAELMENVKAGKVEGVTVISAPFPGGIDDLEV